MKCATALVITAAMLLASPVIAAGPDTTTHRSAQKHEHGSSMLNIAVDGKLVAIDLDGPAANVVGFEHPPANPEQTARLADVLATLRDGAVLFRMPAAAECRMVSAAVSAPSYTANKHGDLESSWEFRCSNPAALTSIEVPLMKVFTGIEKLATSVVTPAGQFQVVLTQENIRVAIPR